MKRSMRTLRPYIVTILAIAGKRITPTEEFPDSAAIKRLTELQPPNLETSTALSAKQIGRSLRFVLVSCFSYAAIVYFILDLLRSFDNVPLRALALVSLMMSVYVLEGYLLWRVTRKMSCYYAIRSSYRLLALVDESPKRWGDPEFMSEVISRIQLLSRRLEFVPMSLGIRHPSVASRLRYAMVGRADTMRELCTWVFSPRITTRSDLLESLEASTRAMVESRWLDLKGSDATAVPLQRGVRLARWGFAILLLILLIGTQVYAATIGPSASTVATVVGILLVGVMGSVGISSENVSIGTKLAESVAGVGTK